MLVPMPMPMLQGWDGPEVLSVPPATLPVPVQLIALLLLFEALPLLLLLLLLLLELLLELPSPRGVLSAASACGRKSANGEVPLPL